MTIERRTFLTGLAAAALASRPARAARRPGEFYVAALAPLGSDLRIEEFLTRDYLAYLREHGTDGALVNGTTGEFPSFSTAERKRNLEVFLRHKGSLSIMCQIGTTNLAETTELLHHAEGAGADSVLILPPFYFNQPSDEGLLRFYEPILETARLPVYLYNIPQLSEVEITLNLVQRLSAFDKLAGIKDSWGKLERTTAYAQDFPKLKVYTGASRLIAQVMKAGAIGALTGNGNVFPSETAELCHAAGDRSAAQAHLDQRATLLKGYAGVPAMKYALSKMGLGRMHVRPPYTELSEEAGRALAAKLKAAGIIT